MAQQATVTTLSTDFGTVRLMKSATLGTGAYGQVCRATLDGKPCAAKLIHPTLVDPDNPRNLRKFEQECRLLSEIRHPNIVQCLGVAQDGETGLPVLLMELMDESLTHFLEQSEEPLAYHVQVNISHDIALAVAFLHSKRIVHRDLSSNNVLLRGDGSRAKVTDFGMSKLDSHMTGLTKCPGTPPYMAPEALLDPPVYTEKLDCFQVGVLMIQTITRKFPDPGPAMNRVRDARYPTGWTNAPVPEVERRQNHLSLIPQTHPMLQVALNCLKDMDSERPSAQHICEDLSALKDISQYGRSLLREGEQLIQQLKWENQEKEKEIKEKERETEEKKKAVREMEMEIRKKEMYIREREREVLERDRKIGSLQSQLRQLEEEVRKAKDEYYDILLLGRTGLGKSTTGNKLLGINRDTLGVLDRLWANYFDTSSVHQECKVLSNKHKTRVMDTMGFADFELTQKLGLLEANRLFFQGILQEKKKHNLTFHRVLYFLPCRGSPERADGTLQDEIKVMYELLGMDIFNIMVIIATQKKGRKYQMFGYDEDEFEKTREVFTIAFKRVIGQHLPKCPPVLYLPFDETDVLNKVVAAEVILDLPHN